jgi:hypothetical protein
MMLKRFLFCITAVGTMSLLLQHVPLFAKADVIDRIDIENLTKTDVQFTVKKAIVNGSGCLRPGQSDRDFYVQKVIDVVIIFERAAAKNGGCGGTGMARELWFRYKPPNETFKAKQHAGGYYVEHS